MEKINKFLLDNVIFIYCLFYCLWAIGRRWNIPILMTIGVSGMGLLALLCFYLLYKVYKSDEKNRKKKLYRRVGIILVVCLLVVILTLI